MSINPALRHPRFLLAVVATLIIAAFLAGRALAGGVPSTSALTYSGTLEDSSGAPLGGDHNLLVRLWPAASGGTDPVCTTDSQAVTVTGGHFAVTLPDACTDAVKANPDLWVDVLVDGASLGRTKLGAVPFAVEAGHTVAADTASDAAGALKTTVDGLVARGTRIVSTRDNRTGCPPTAAAETDLMSVSFDLTKTTPVYANGDMIRNYNGRADLGLFVDGTLQNLGISYSTTQAWAPAHVAWSGTLDAGSHTISVRATNGSLAIADVWGCGKDHDQLTAILYE